MSEHFVIPDTQVRKGVPINHLTAAGNYVVDRQPDTIIHLGDNWDMPSLSEYDVGTAKHEGARYVDDIEAGKNAMDAFMQPIIEYNRRRAQQKMRQYKPRMVFLQGNHENRIDRAANKDPKLMGKISTEDFQLGKMGWEEHPFLEIVDIDGILYSHYFVNQQSLYKRALGGTINNKLTKIGQSFTMGHQQHRQIGEVSNATGKVLRGIVWGAFYQHDEDYLGPQGNHYPRGCIYKHEVKDGDYCIMELSMDYLLRAWQ